MSGKARYTTNSRCPAREACLSLPLGACRAAIESLCFNTASAHATIYNSPAPVRKDERYGGLSVSRRTPNLITSVEKEPTRFKRRVQAKFLGWQALLQPQTQSRILAQIAAFLEVLGCGCGSGDDDGAPRSDPTVDAWGAPVDLARTCNWLTLDIISEFVFGEPVGLLCSSERRWFADTISTMRWRCIIVRFLPDIPEKRLSSRIS